VDGDDLVQEVLAAIARKNTLPRSAYDPRRASFSKYVWIVARSTAANVANREGRLRRVRGTLIDAGMVPHEPPAGDALEDVHDGARRGHRDR
jgi:DNA-directed RNA polymerase specialized sigma24 family protein